MITLFIIGSIQLSASVWQRVNGPTESKTVTSIFNFNNQIYSSSVNGVFVTDDEENWSKSDQSIFDSTGVVVRVFYQKENVSLISGSNGKPFVSYNNGDTWEAINNINRAMDGYETVLIIGETIFAQESFNSGNSIHKLEKGSKVWEKVFFDTEKKDSIFASHIVADGDYIFVGDEDVDGINKTGGGITVSSDKGNTWYKLDNFKRPVTSMVIHNNKLFVAASDNYIYRSSDKGITWEVDTNLIMPTDYFLSHNGNLFAAVNNTASIYLAEYGILISSDDGISWEKVGEEYHTINIKDIEVKDSKLYVLNTFGKVFESTNNGRVWLQSKLMDSNIYSSKFIQDKDTLYVSGGYGIFFSTDKGINWYNKSEDLEKYTLRIKDIYKNKNVFAAVSQYRAGITISSDGGFTWNTANIFFPNPQWVSGVHILEDKIVVTSAYQEIETRYSTDFGETWEIFDDPVLKKEYSLGKLIRDDVENITWFTSGGIMKSSNNGIDWVNAGESKPYVAVSLIDNGIYYGYGSESYIYKSTDKGFNWETTDYEITNYASFIFKVIEGNLIVPGRNSFKISSDFGETFVEYPIDTSLIKKLPIGFQDFIIQDDYLLATSFEGIWRAKLSDLGIEAITSVESETENNYLYTYPPYPLPAKSEVKVLFYWDINLPMTVDDISIYDLSGQKILTSGNLRLEKQASHKGNIIWDCSSAQAGVYIISIKHGTEEKSVKVIVE